MADRHVSVVHDVSDVKLATCHTCCNGGSESYHCPICHPSQFQPTQKRKVQQHLQTHYDNRVTYNDINMLPCQLECVKTKPQGPRVHFHCPFCDVTRSRKESIIDHVKSCENNLQVPGAIHSTELKVDSSVSKEKVLTPLNKAPSESSTSKDQKEESEQSQVEDMDEECDGRAGTPGAGGDVPVVRKRGRPPKKKPDTPKSSPSGCGDNSSIPTPAASEVTDSPLAAVVPTTAKRKRGRPPKRVLESTPELPTSGAESENPKTVTQEQQPIDAPTGDSHSATAVIPDTTSHQENDLSEEVGNILVSLSEGKLELLPMEANDESVSSKVFVSTPATGDEEWIPSEKQWNCKTLPAEPRVSRRLAVKRESGKNFVWEALMKSVRGGSQSPTGVGTSSCETPNIKESSTKLTSATAVSASQKANSDTAVKKGRGRPKKVQIADVSPSKKKRLEQAKGLDNVSLALEEKLTKQAGGTDEVFSQVAAVVSGGLLARIPAAKEKVIADIAERAHMTLSSTDGALFFLHGSLEGLLDAKKMLAELRQEEIDLPVTNDRETSPPPNSNSDPQRTAAAPAGPAAPEHEDDSQTHEDVEDTCHQGQMEDEVSLAVEFHVEDKEDSPEYVGLSEAEISKLADDAGFNPATGRRYSRLCAIYRNPKLATVTCDVCGFRSTEKGIQKHKLRLHPERMHLCEACGRTFGVRYDMRRHRMMHFDENGKMFPDALEVFRKYHPEVSGEVTLEMVEAGFGKEEESIQDLMKSEENGEGSEFTLPSQEIIKENGTEDANGNSSEVQLTNEESALEDTEKPKPTTEIAFPPRMKFANSLANKNPSKAMYICDQCGFRSSHAGLIKHKQRHHPQLVYQCTLCDLKFGIVNDMLRHYKTHGTAAKGLGTKDVKANAACGLCEFTGEERSVKSHLGVKHHVSAVPCLHCGSTFPTQKSLQKHFRNKHPEIFTSAIPTGKAKLQLPRDESRKKCNVCGSSIRSSWMTYHMKTHNRATLVCEECGFSTVKRFEMKAHMKAKHGPAQYMCHICGQTFTLQNSQKTHMKNKHSEVTPQHACNECEKVFTDRRFLMTHIKRVHLKQKKFFCDVCNKGFFEKIRMKEHRTIHTSEEEREAQKTLECKYCGRRFRKAQQLSQHENTHTGNRPYKCKICGKAYAWASEIHKHKRTHSDEKPFRCTQCDRSFKFQYKLATHMITHTRKSRHVCNLCGKVFTLMATLKRHRCKLARSSGLTMVDLTKIAEASAQIQDTDDAPTHVYIQVEDEETAIAGENIIQIQMQENEAEATNGEELVTYMCGLCQQLYATPQEINDHVMFDHSESVTVVVEEGENIGAEIAMSEVVMTTTDSNDEAVIPLEVAQEQENVSYVQPEENSEHGFFIHQVAAVEEGVEVEQHSVEMVEAVGDEETNQQIILVQNVIEENDETMVKEGLDQEITHVLLEQS